MDFSRILCQKVGIFREYPAKKSLIFRIIFKSVFGNNFSRIGEIEDFKGLFGKKS